ncbi:ammonia channel protein AmtB [Saccharomonospora amisosensis]|uniref:Ammonia channel protein AmtB n=1 Tax=Saccharomonospora amisosensis TaxID=1128677 RepID=A0A7X5USI8_9PSEU|nr:ammonium transporter [Saccharomonospora amisosensis]NIJ12944.1 ammonia channel protein AmtB [Saccharomonospora amisosensis]
MDSELTALTTIFTEFYYWLTIVFMFLIHVGFTLYEVGTARRKNLQHTLMKNVMLIPVVTVTFFLFGWWLYYAVGNGPGITGGIGEAAADATPWSPLLAPNLDDNITGVFWAAFLLFSWTAASIVSGAIIERARTGAFLIMAVLVGSVTWVIGGAWGWSATGWLVQTMGYHDAYGSGVIHAVAGGAALGMLVVLGPRIGKFGPRGEVRDIKPHNVWLTGVGLFIILVGFWGFYAACNIPIINVGSDSDPLFAATTIYGTPTTLSGNSFNLLMSLIGGMAVGFVLSKGSVLWTFSGALGGIITASAGNDLYHPLQAMLIGAVGVFIAFKLHHWVERRFKIDDAVGAVAVHGYTGFLALVIAGFVLWGYPAAAPVEGVSAWLGSNADGWPVINPLGQLIGALIMFWVLGFLPTFAVAKLLDKFGLLRVPRKVELAGLDTHGYDDAYPEFSAPNNRLDDVELEALLGATAREDRRS